MSKLRIKVSGCMRSMTGAETFCLIRTYLATAARHGISALDALTLAAKANPGSPAPDNQAEHESADSHNLQRDLSSYPISCFRIKAVSVNVNGSADPN
jgi:hypothetical protein